MAQRSRTYRREQRHRMALKRIRQYRARFGQRAIDEAVENGWRIFSPGMFHNEQPHMGCHRARCQMCHYDKLHEPRRIRERSAWQAVEVAAWEGDEAPLDVTEFEQHEFVYDERGFCMTPPPIEYAGVWSQTGHRLGDLSDIDTHYVTGQKIYEVEDDYGYRWWVSASDHHIR